MSVVISSVTPGSPAEKAGLHGGDTLISINDNEIVDVLDYRFYQDVTRPVLKYIDENGKLKKARIKKREYEELGLEFETYLMDKQHSCRNKNPVDCYFESKNLKGFRNIVQNQFQPRETN